MRTASALLCVARLWRHPPTTNNVWMQAWTMSPTLGCHQTCGSLIQRLIELKVWDYNWRAYIHNILITLNTNQFNQQCFGKVKDTKQFWNTQTEKKSVVLGNTGIFNRSPVNSFCFFCNSEIWWNNVLTEATKYRQCSNP